MRINYINVVQSYYKFFNILIFLYKKVHFDVFLT